MAGGHTDIGDLLTTPAAALGAREVLRSSPLVLLGVDEEAAACLERLGLGTVYDLAFSRLFATAAELVAASSDRAHPYAAFGRAPADRAADARLTGDLGAAPVEVIDGIGPALAEEIGRALGVRTVRELALWPPQRAARRVADAAFGARSSGATDDDGTPTDLVPRSGDLPTERVFYETVLLDAVAGTGRSAPSLATHHDRGGADAQDLATAGPLDLLGPAAGGHTSLATGAVLRWSQSWFGHGVALGQLLHSIALAPGESTRVAVLDWSRRSAAGVVEDVSQAESLVHRIGRNRAISEVASAVAHEAQSGRSASFAEGESGEVGISFGGTDGKVSGAVGGGYAKGWSRASSFASSAGYRDLAATMAQRVADVTDQAASSVRNRRASVIREVSQSEGERVSTRILTNHNHMHALSVQYYEVVQVFRTVVRLEEAHPCLFVPVAPVRFDDPTTVQRFRGVLAEAALEPWVRRALEAAPSGVVITAPPLPEGTRFGTTEVFDGAMLEGLDVGGTGFRSVAPNQLLAPGDLAVAPIEQWDSHGGVSVVSCEAVRRTGPPFQVGRGQAGSTWPRQPGSNGRAPVPLWDLAELRVTLQRDEGVPEPAPGEEVVAGYFRLLLAGDPAGEELEALLFTKAAVPAAGRSTYVLRFEGGRFVEQQVRQHLEDNAAHYQAAIWQSLDGAAIAGHLARYRYEGRPVLEVVDPDPIAIAGNLLALRVHPVGDEARDRWAAWCKERGVEAGTSTSSLVPLPSGGVFAEAVLGRSNSAEKLDITRFWNWQDSPVPQAPEIAPIPLGSRAQPEDLRPGDLAAPIVNVVTPPAAPDPTGMAAVLTALQQGGMFRDMSGAAATALLAQEALKASAAGASHAATTTADVAKAVAAAQAGAGAKSAPPPTTPSEKGAVVNQLTKAEAPKAGAGGGGPAETPTRAPDIDDLDLLDLLGTPIPGGSSSPAHDPAVLRALGVPGPATEPTPSTAGRDDGTSALHGHVLAWVEANLDDATGKPRRRIGFVRPKVGLLDDAVHDVRLRQTTARFATAKPFDELAAAMLAGFPELVGAEIVAGPVPVARGTELRWRVPMDRLATAYAAIPALAPVAKLRHRRYDQRVESVHRSGDELRVFMVTTTDCPWAGGESFLLRAAAGGSGGTPTYELEGRALHTFPWAPDHALLAADPELTTFASGDAERWAAQLGGASEPAHVHDQLVHHGKGDSRRAAFAALERAAPAVLLDLEVDHPELVHLLDELAAAPD